MRLDEYLVINLNVESRNKANKLIDANFVVVNNNVVNKKNYLVKENDCVKIIEDIKYVSRSGFKLEKAIDVFNIDCNNKVVLDIGASTGGFSDVCLQKGAKKVYSLDIGENQLHRKIKDDNRVVMIDKTNVKDLSVDIVSEQIDLVVSDLSFISSKFMFAAIRNINLSNDVNIISLIKPQFELDKKIVSKQKGFVSEKYHRGAIDKVSSYAKQYNFKVIEIINSPIKGAKKNNQEYLLWAKNG